MSTLLVRTRSKARSFRTILCYASATPSQSPRIPVEIVDYIVALALACTNDPDIPDFGAIAPLTLASADFRRIALRRFVHDMNVTDKYHWTGMFNMLKSQGERDAGRMQEGYYDWVKILRAPSKALLEDPTRLTRLNQLRALSIDLGEEGLSTQHPTLKALFHNLTAPTLSHTMKSLTLSSLPRIDVPLLHMIATTFPSLSDLSLSCTERLKLNCCWTCFEDTLTWTMNSPIPNFFSNFKALTHAFARALEPLIDLTHLHLGILLSDDQLLYRHMTHCILNDELEGPGLVDGAPLCRECHKKIAKQVRSEELAAGLIMAQKLKKLRSIGWSSFFYRDLLPSIPEEEEEERDQEDPTMSGSEDEADDETVQGKKPAFAVPQCQDIMKITIWIMRSKGRVRVRRKSWTV